MRIARGVQFGVVSKEVMRRPDLSPQAKALYALLTTYASQSSRSWSISRRRLAQDLGVSVDSIKRYLTELEGHSLIVRQRQYREGGGERVAKTVLRDFLAVHDDVDLAG